MSAPFSFVIVSSIRRMESWCFPGALSVWSMGEMLFVRDYKGDVHGFNWPWGLHVEHDAGD